MGVKHVKKIYDWYDFGALLSRNGTFNFVVGGRGLGKTYGAKKKCIKDFIKDGSQFIYLRRYQSEMGVKNTFFEDVKVEFPEYTFRVNGNRMQLCLSSIGDPSPDDWKTIGFFAVLSKGQSHKSGAYPDVRTIIFDEFILENGFTRYIPDEANAFNGFYSTVDRNQDKTRVLFLANAVSIMNPYFIEYDIQPSDKSEFVVKANGFLVAHFVTAESFAEQVRTTKFGSFISERSFGKYALDNEFADAHQALIGKKTSKAKFMYALATKNYPPIGIWCDRDVYPRIWYINERIPTDVRGYVVMDVELMKEGNYMMQYSEPLIRHLRTAYGRSQVFFETPQQRNAFSRVFKR